MLFDIQPASEKRKKLREIIRQPGKAAQFFGAYSPLVAMQAEKSHVDGIYISGAVVANDLGYPDIGLTTQTEITMRARQIARVSNLPTIIDIDTGFGEPLNVMRTVQELEEAGISGCHLEDQENPKRCGHLDNKSIVSIDEMCRKISAGARGRKDPNFVLIARTDARASEGLDAAIDRAKAYMNAGADMIFPEALKTKEEFKAFKDAVGAPMLANMTEFGKSDLFTRDELSALGFELIIYPVTSQRIALGAVSAVLESIKKDGSQAAHLDNMQTRQELYDLLRYEDYNAFDQSVFNFDLKNNRG
jgi:methylisocitrate lyase